MATELKGEDKKKDEYLEGIIKTVIPFIFGVLAGLISFSMLGSNPTSEDGLLIALLMVMIQKFVFQFLHRDLEGAKDWIYISFMTLFCWFLTFSLLLN